jgi:demethylmenaquinone methyltransferase/2-methoxy-6-polyprenyl-1,4-benzoquinol methylase
MTRAVEPGGRVVCLELMKPEGRLLGLVYRLYSRRVVPLVGGLIHGSREPYEYLPESIESFHSREELTWLMEKVGLEDIAVCDLTGGVVAVHTGTKR